MMNRIFFTLVFVCFTATLFGQYTVNLEGIIRSPIGLELPNYPVFIFSDEGSDFQYSKMTQTDFQGYYSDIFTVPASVTEGVINVMVKDCEGVYVIKKDTFSVSNPNTEVTHNNICWEEEFGCSSYFTYLNPNADSVQFFANPTGQPPFTYEWNFGDNSPLSNEANPQHHYATAGQYFADCTITDALGCQHTSGQQVLPGECTADFEFTVNADGAYEFTPILTGTVPFGYFWTFGDGVSFSFEENPIHEFTSPGTYTVFLSGIDNDFCSANISKEITIDGTPCDVDFTSEVSFFNENEVTYTPSPTGEAPYTYSWYNLGDGSSNTSEIVTHTYTEAGQYYVCMEMTAGNGCVSDTCHIVNVGGCAVAAGFFSTFDTSVGYQFFPTAPNPNFSFIWDFGDGSDWVFGAEQIYVFETAGTYEVCLTVSESTGCVATYCEEVIYDGTVSTNNLAPDFKFNLFPNPVHDKLNLSITTNSLENISIKLFATDGQLIQDFGNKKINGNALLEFSLKNLPQGIYWIELASPFSNIMRKIVRL